MSKNIEVENRGPLTKKEYLRLKNFLTKRGRPTEHKSRLTLMYFRHHIPVHVNEIKNDPIDLRLRITNGQAALVLKYGNWAGSDMRKEFEIFIDKDKFEAAIGFLAALGWTRAVVYATEAFVFNYKKIEFALIEIKNYGFMYEAEILSRSQKQALIAQHRIQQTCQALGLREYQSKEFEAQCNNINQVRSLQFDFAKDSFMVIKNRFKKNF